MYRNGKLLDHGTYFALCGEGDDDGRTDSGIIKRKQFEEGHFGPTHIETADYMDYLQI
jgi:hypothetical protein